MALTWASDGMPGYEWDHYETSLKMSSYLVALMVSDFIKIPSDPTLSNVEFNIWSRTIVQNQTEYDFLLKKLN